MKDKQSICMALQGPDLARTAHMEAFSNSDRDPPLVRKVASARLGEPCWSPSTRSINLTLEDLSRRSGLSATGSDLWL
jgi:hypothetical protein